MKYKMPSKCKTCLALSTRGIKDGKHDRWCCHYGKPAYKAVGECTLKGGYRPKAGGR